MRGRASSIVGGSRHDIDAQRRSLLNNIQRSLSRQINDETGRLDFQESFLNAFDKITSDRKGTTAIKALSTN